MKQYELTYLSSSDVSEKVKNFIQEENGIVEKSTEPSQREETFLTCLEFSLTPEKLKNLEKKLKTEKQIIRYMIILKKKLKQVSTKEKPAQKIVKPPHQIFGKGDKPELKKVELKEIDQKIEEILKE